MVNMRQFVDEPSLQANAVALAIYRLYLLGLALTYRGFLSYRKCKQFRIRPDWGSPLSSIVCCPQFRLVELLQPEPFVFAQSYCQYFYNATATALRLLHMAGEAGSLGARLRALEQQHQKSCDVDAGALLCGCRAVQQPQTRHLLKATG